MRQRLIDGSIQTSEKMNDHIIDRPGSDGPVLLLSFSFSALYFTCCCTRKNIYSIFDVVLFVYMCINICHWIYYYSILCVA